MRTAAHARPIGLRAVAVLLTIICAWAVPVRPAVAGPARPTANAPFPAPGELRVRAAGILRHDFGTTRYHFASLAYLDSAQMVIGNVASELDFPVNAAYAGANFTVLSARANGLPWSLAAEALVPLNDPGAVMRDHDWMTWPDRFDGKFSYTESDATLRGYDIALSGSWGTWRSGPWLIEALAGFQTYRVDEDLRGIRGWQLDSEFRRHDFSFQDTLALTYRITYYVYSAGIRAGVGSAGGSSLALSVSPALASMSDVDDHVLRFKRSTASGTGAAILTRLEARLPLGRTPGARTTALVFSASDEYASIHAKQTQRWYGDDPASPENDTGDVVSGLAHDVTLKHATLDLRLDIGF